MTGTKQLAPGALVVRKPRVCTLVGLSAATVDRLRARGDFPAPIKLGEQAVGWTMASIQAWIDSRPVAQHFVDAIEI